MASSQFNTSPPQHNKYQMKIQEISFTEIEKYGLQDHKNTHLNFHPRITSRIRWHRINSTSHTTNIKWRYKKYNLQNERNMVYKIKEIHISTSTLESLTEPNGIVSIQHLSTTNKYQMKIQEILFTKKVNMVSRWKKYIS